MTYSVAYLAVPQAAWDFIAHALEQAGYECAAVTRIGDTLTVSLNMQGIALVPTGDSDTLVNSGRLVDYTDALGEEAFRAGFEAASDSTDYYESWSKYEPSKILQELGDNL